MRKHFISTTFCLLLSCTYASIKAQTTTTYSILSTAYDRGIGVFYSLGDLDSYWLITKMENMVIPPDPNSVVIFPEDPTYVVQNSGNNYFSGIINDHSINYNASTVSEGQKVITYRTYFTLPDLSLTTNGYSLSFKMSADDAVDNVKLNGIEKGRYLGNNYSNIPGITKPYLLTIPVCDTSLRSGLNFIDVTIADAGGSIGFYAEITLFQTTSVCISQVGTKEYKKEGSIFSIFPNPSHTNFTIFTSNLNEIHQTTLLSIYSIDGKLLKTEIIPKSTLSNHVINTSNFSDGLYYINITSGNYTQNMKFVKN